ncbi:hypothetical protein [Saccharopolyspora gloriosae]|uniref:hypothetical protein n=1 Tax=Saccharopolyspora gloriosae TaxID=455344 RepID=UPI001FB6DC3B|nr:hypothetical protein [Saccharopolyspora gloriosae]
MTDETTAGAAEAEARAVSTGRTTVAVVSIGMTVRVGRSVTIGSGTTADVTIGTVVNSVAVTAARSRVSRIAGTGRTRTSSETIAARTTGAMTNAAVVAVRMTGTAAAANRAVGSEPTIVDAMIVRSPTVRGTTARTKAGTATIVSGWTSVATTGVMIAAETVGTTTIVVMTVVVVRRTTVGGTTATAPLGRKASGSASTATGRVATTGSVRAGTAGRAVRAATTVATRRGQDRLRKPWTQSRLNRHRNFRRTLTPPSCTVRSDATCVHCRRVSRTRSRPTWSLPAS